MVINIYYVFKHFKASKAIYILLIQYFTTLSDFKLVFLAFLILFIVFSRQPSSHSIGLDDFSYLVKLRIQLYMGSQLFSLVYRSDCMLGLVTT
jgi:hypothetical protein